MEENTNEENLVEKAENILTSYGHTKYMDIHIRSLEPGRVTGIMNISEKQRNFMDNVHGGALFSFADTLAGIVSASEGFGGVTAQGSMNFIAGAKGDRITGEAEIIKNGRSLIYIEVHIKDEEDKLCATASFVYYRNGDKYDRCKN
ncbi:MAG: PaaI family thioesterase, partial [Lachnospiraceae bacterium]|nr:PaaI family thioesterase [Lachnospiraceae bacterium]